MTQRVGIFGGTFDPPHIGHLILADHAIETLDLDELLFVPAADPPHKKNQTRLPIEHRLAMLQIILIEDNRFTLSRVDIDRPGPHFAVETVSIIQEQYPGAEVYFVMGADSLRDLPKWDRPQQLIQLCKLAVIPRPNIRVSPDMHEAVIPGLAQRVVMLDEPLIQISSTGVVEKLNQGRSVRYLVPDPVRSYIEQHNLYG